MSSHGTTYTFLEAESVDFSSKQIDTKTTLHWFLKVVQFPQRATVFARGACDIPGISNHSEVTFVDCGSDELLLVKKLGDDPSSIMYINVNSDVKVCVKVLHGDKLYLIHQFILMSPQCTMFKCASSNYYSALDMNDHKHHFSNTLASVLTGLLHTHAGSCCQVQGLQRI